MANVAKLPVYIAKLFTPRPPIKYLKPNDISPEKRCTTNISGISQYLNYLKENDDNYIPTESWLQKQQKEKVENNEKNQKKLEEAISNWKPSKDPQVRGDAYTTIFVARLDYSLTEVDLQKEFVPYGPIERVRVVRDKEGKSRGYAFIVFEKERDATNAYKSANGMRIKDRKIVVDIERGRTIKNWKPKRLGGGLGGRGYSKPKIETTIPLGPKGLDNSYRGQNGGGYGRSNGIPSGPRSDRDRDGYGGRGGGYRDRDGGRDDRNRDRDRGSRRDGDKRRQEDEDRYRERDAQRKHYEEERRRKERDRDQDRYKDSRYEKEKRERPWDRERERSPKRLRY